MGMLRIMSKRGDDRVTWDNQNIAIGDTEADAAVREAKRIFDESRAKGASAFKIDTNKFSTRIETFDPTAEQIVIIPRVVGG